MVGARGLDQVHDVALHRLRDEHVLERPLHRQDLVARHHRRNRRLVLPPLAPPLEDEPLLVHAGVADADTHQEPVELRLGEGIGAFELDRVLGRDDDERRLQAKGLALHAHLRLLHRFQERGLRLRRRPVDLVGEQEMREDRARPEFEAGLPLVVQEASGDVGGQEVGRALQPFEGEVQGLREQPRDERLGEPWIILDQDVARAARISPLRSVTRAMVTGAPPASRGARGAPRATVRGRSGDPRAGRAEPAARSPRPRAR